MKLHKNKKQGEEPRGSSPCFLLTSLSERGSEKEPKDEKEQADGADEDQHGEKHHANAVEIGL